MCWCYYLPVGATRIQRMPPPHSPCTLLILELDSRSTKVGNERSQKIHKAMYTPPGLFRVERYSKITRPVLEIVFLRIIAKLRGSVWWLTCMTSGRKISRKNCHFGTDTKYLKYNSSIFSSHSDIKTASLLCRHVRLAEQTFPVANTHLRRFQGLAKNNKRATKAVDE